MASTLSLLQTGSHELGTLAAYVDDKGLVDGHYYSDKAPLPSWLLVAPLWIVEKISPAESLEHRFKRSLAIGGFLFASIPLAVFGLWLLRDGFSLAATVIVLCGTFLWIYAGTFFGHVFAGMLIVAAHRLAFRRRQPLVAGLFLGAAFLSEFPTGLALPAFVLAMLGAPRGMEMRARFSWPHMRPVLSLVAGFTLVAGLILPYNAAITGHPFTMVYSYAADPTFAAMRTSLGFGQSAIPHAMFGLLFSPARALFVYAPICGLVFIRGRSWMRRLRAHTAVPAGAVFFIASLCLFSSYFMWTGGWAYGPRHLIPAVMLAIAEIAPLAADDERLVRPWMRRGVLLVAGILGIGPAFAAKVTVQYYVPDVFASPLTEVIWPLFRDGRWNDKGLTSILFGWSPVASAACFVTFAIGGGVAIWLVTTRRDRLVARPTDN